MKEVETEKDVVEPEKSKKSEVKIPVATDEVNKLWEGVSKKAGGHGVKGDRESKLLDTVINENVQGKKLIFSKNVIYVGYLGGCLRVCYALL